MAKYYPDIAKGAKGKTENSFFRSSQIKRARRSMLDLISLFCSRHISLTTQCAMLSTDLLTGSLTYENKFSLDAKPIEGGVRVVVVFVIAFESDSFSLPTPTIQKSTRKGNKVPIFVLTHSSSSRAPQLWNALCCVVIV